MVDPVEVIARALLGDQVTTNEATWIFMVTKARAVLSALEATGMVVQGWQPIESAPENEWVIIAWDWSNGGVNLGRCIGGLWQMEGYESGGPPTHWLAIPDPPHKPR